MRLDRPRKGRKEIIVPDSAHTRLGQENSEKYSKKIQKIKKPVSGIISSQNGDDISWEREKKILGPNSVRTRPGQENSEKNSKKIQKMKKPISGTISSQNGMI